VSDTKPNSHPKVSNAEIQIFEELNKLGLTGGMVTQKPINVTKQVTPEFFCC